MAERIRISVTNKVNVYVCVRVCLCVCGRQQVFVLLRCQLATTQQQHKNIPTQKPNTSRLPMEMNIASEWATWNYLPASIMNYELRNLQQQQQQQQQGETIGKKIDKMQCTNVELMPGRAIAQCNGNSEAEFESECDGDELKVRSREQITQYG